MFFDLYGFLGINLSSETNYLLTKDFEDGIVENKFKSVVNPEKNDLYEFVDLFYSLSRPNDFNGQKMSGEDTMVLQTLKEENSFYTPGLHSLRHLYGSLKDEINRDWNKVISF